MPLWYIMTSLITLVLNIANLDMNMVCWLYALKLCPLALAPFFLQASVMNVDRYAAAESFYKLAMAFAPVPDLHIMWLLHLCDAHQEMQSWAEAAQCAVAVAGVVMQVKKLGLVVSLIHFKLS